MTRALRGITLAFCLSVSTVVAPTPAHPIVDTIVGVVGGGLLLDKAGNELQDAIASARAAGEALIRLADEKGEERLNQVNQILEVTVANLIGQTEESALRIIAQATQQMSVLERQIVADVLKAIREVECAVVRLTGPILLVRFEC